MKRILLFLFCLTSYFVSNAQYPATGLKQKFTQGVGLGSKDSTAFNANDSLVVSIDRNGKMIFRGNGVNAPFKVVSVTSDTAAMLLPYLRKSDTASMLAPYARASSLGIYLLKSDSLSGGYTTWLLTKKKVDSLGAVKLNISDTAAMLSPYARTSSLGSYLLKSDSLSGGYTTWLLTKKKIDSLGAVKLNISDTAAMLSPYARTSSLGSYLLKSDSLSGGYTTWLLTKKKIDSLGAVKLSVLDTAAMLANRLKISDTAYMLSGYARTGNIPSTANFVPYVGAVDNVNLGNFRLTARSLKTDSIYSNSSAGGILSATGGSSVMSWGAGGSVEVDFHGFAGYDANRSASYTARSFTDKNYVDSADGLRLLKSDTAAMLRGYKTYYPRTAISLTTTGTSGAATYNNSTGVLNIPQYSPDLSGYVPTSRTLTINGTAFDLSANRSWSVGTVTAVTASAPLSSSGGTTPNITISQANTSTNGFLSSTDWNTFNNKQNAITLTTTGSSGAATLVGSTLNIPNYGSALSGYLPLTGGTLTGGLTGTTGSFSSSGSANTFNITHSSGSGIALSITKGGNGEGIYVNKTGGSGNAATIVGTLEATSIVRTGGTSSQFLKADGSVDNNTYATTGSLSGYLPLSGGTLTGALNGTSAAFSGAGSFTGNAATTAAITANNATGSSGTAQWYQNFTSGATVISRFSRGNGASGLTANGLNIDNFEGFQIRANQLGGSGGSINLLGGNVGIGTTSPSSFSGYRNLSLQASTSGFNLDFFNNSGTRNAAIIYTNAVDFNFSAIENIPIRFETNAIERMRITSGGNTLIKTTTDNGTDALQVAGSGNFTGSVTMGRLATYANNASPSATTNVGMAVFESSSSVQLQMGGIAAIPFSFWMQTKQSNNSGSVFPLSINPLGGNVGIGTTNPTRLFHIYKPSTEADLFIESDRPPRGWR